LSDWTASVWGVWAGGFAGGISAGGQAQPETMIRWGIYGIGVGVFRGEI